MTGKNVLIFLVIALAVIAAYFWYTRSQMATAAAGLGPMGTAPTGTIAAVPVPRSALDQAPRGQSPTPSLGLMT